MDQRQLSRGLGWFSIGLGLVELAAPRKVTEMLGVNGYQTLVQMLGAREIATGIGILTQPDNPEWLWARVGGDAMDLALLGAAASVENSRGGMVAAATAAVAGAAALDLLCAQQLGGGPAIPKRNLLQLTQHGEFHLEKAITINRSREDLYRFWRHLEDLPRVMNHIRSVEPIDERRSHWVARGPAGMNVEWDAEITEDRPNELIAWRSLEGAEVDNAGSVRLEPAPAGRGTVVRVAMDYRPPAGRIGLNLAKILGESPEKQIETDLLHLKQLLETGEIATTAGQPAGGARSVSKYDEFARA
jgi:uncharacterized membrane protein